MEFRAVVPSRVRTVLLPMKTLKPPGVANNSADNTAPVAISRRVAPRANAMGQATPTSTKDEPTSISLKSPTKL